MRDKAFDLKADEKLTAPVYEPNLIATYNQGSTKM